MKSPKNYVIIKEKTTLVEIQHNLQKANFISRVSYQSIDVVSAGNDKCIFHQQLGRPRWSQHSCCLIEGALECDNISLAKVLGLESDGAAVMN